MFDLSNAIEYNTIQILYFTFPYYMTVKKKIFIRLVTLKLSRYVMTKLTM